MSMRSSTSFVAVCIAIVAGGLLSPMTAQAQAGDGAQWVMPRTPDGHPDLQGNWTNVTLTPFERAPGRGPVFTAEEVEDIERVTDGCPAKPGAAECGRAVAEASSSPSLTNERFLSGREYNEVYWDRGTRVAIVNGEPRSSLVTNPSNGRRPPLTPEAQQSRRELRAARPQFGQYDNPENRPLAERCIVSFGSNAALAERCIVSFGSNAGPPISPNGAYNNNYTIVQTADFVMIHTEMVHDTRIIRLGEPDPLPEGVRPWFGDSWGRWEGDVLVVETTNLNPRQSYSTPGGTVLERFTRADEDTMLYEFTIDDPSTYTQQWGGEVPFKRLYDLVYEYSCHEGNYALANVLSGARYQEAQAARNGPEPR